MPEVRLGFADGQVATSDRPGDLYEALWLLSDRRGAISAAGKIAHARSFVSRREMSVHLDENESKCVREALSRLEPGIESPPN
jgi:hypothetical protein